MGASRMLGSSNSSVVLVQVQRCGADYTDNLRSVAFSLIKPHSQLGSFVRVCFGDTRFAWYFELVQHTHVSEDRAGGSQLQFGEDKSRRYRGAWALCVSVVLDCGVSSGLS